MRKTLAVAFGCFVAATVFSAPAHAADQGGASTNESPAQLCTDPNIPKPIRDLYGCR